MEIMNLACDMYQAYGNKANWKNHQGEPMPQWSELPENIRSYWGAAAACAMRDLVERVEAEEHLIRAESAFKDEVGAGEPKRALQQAMDRLEECMMWYERA